MKTRKAFLTAAASSAFIAAAPPSPVPSPSPKPTPKISDAARALAAQMRSFDPQLDEKQIEAIAQSIDGNLKIGNDVNPRGKALANRDEPITVFEVP